MPSNDTALDRPHLAQPTPVSPRRRAFPRRLLPLLRQARSPRWTRYRVCLYLLLGLLAVDALLAAFGDRLRRYDPDDYLARVENCRSRPRDLVLVGGSVVSEGIDPTILAGVSWRGQPLQHVFNLGLPGATTSEVWYAVKHGLETPPRLLVYALTASDINDGRFEPHGAASLMDTADLAEWLRSRPESAEWIARHFLEGKAPRCWQLWRYRNALRLGAADHADQLWPGSFPEAASEARRLCRYSVALQRDDGYSPHPETRNSRLDCLRRDGGVPKEFWAFAKYQVHGGHLSCLYRLLDWAEARGVPVVLVDMPVSAELETTMHPQAFVTYRQVLAEVERQRGVRVLRAHREVLDFHDEDFIDVIHLNVRGTARFSAWLRDRLAELGETP